MVIARLIDGDGVDRGVHNFLVPLRSMKDHTLLKGVKTGDIGPKIGYNVMDNGFCSFDHVHIPRRNMAMRFAVVDEQGRYTKKHVSDAVLIVAGHDTIVGNQRHNRPGDQVTNQAFQFRPRQLQRQVLRTRGVCRDIRQVDFCLGR